MNALLPPLLSSSFLSAGGPREGGLDLEGIGFFFLLCNRLRHAHSYYHSTPIHTFISLLSHTHSSGVFSRGAEKGREGGPDLEGIHSYYHYSYFINQSPLLHTLFICLPPPLVSVYVLTHTSPQVTHIIKISSSSLPPSLTT
jgi:hypothetical protein